MSAPKHTPGPCLRGPHRQDACVKCLNADVARFAGQRTDLLEALAAVLPHAERWAQELGEIDERTGVSEHSIEAWRAVESARAAIAKARGQS